MAHMLGTQAETGEDQRKGVVRSLRQKLARLRRQLRDINNDVGALGDDPYDMGAAFIAEGDGSSDDEYEEFYARDSIRATSGTYTAWAMDRLLTVFKMFDDDKDSQLNFREFRHFLLRTGNLEEFDGVCGSEDAYRTCIAKAYDTGNTGDLVFTGFAQLCNEAWPDEQLIRMCNTLGVELRYRYDTEQHRVLRVFKQFAPDERNRIKARCFQMLAYECGCLLTERTAKETAATCVAETRKHDKESRVDPEADEAGKTELDSDEMSDEDTKSGGKKKAKHVKGKFAFHPFLRWWHEVGFIKACAQRRTLRDNMSVQVRELRLNMWLKHRVRHMRGAYHLFREHIKQSLIAGVYDTQRARVPQQTRSRIVMSASMGRPRSAGAAGTPLAFNFQAQRTSIPDAWEHAGVPSGAKAFIDIQFHPEAHTTEDGLKEVYASCEEVLRMDVRRLLRGVPGFMDARPRLTAEEGTPLFAVCLYLSEHPFGALELLRAHLEERTPAAFSKSKTAADLRAEEEEERAAGAAASASAKPKYVKQVERVSKSKHSGITASKRGQRRQAAMKKATALATANLSKKVFEVPKHGRWRPVLRDMSLKLSSTFSLADMFSEGASFARVVQFAVDGAFEVDTQLLAGLSDAVFRVFEYFRHQAELQTPGRPAGATTDDKNRQLLLRKVMKKAALTAIDAGLGFFASADVAVMSDNKAGVFKPLAKGKCTPRLAVDGSGFRIGLKTRLLLGALKLARFLRRTQDVQLKWQSFSFLRSIQSSRFLRTTLTPAQAERFEESVKEVGYPAQVLKQMKAWFKRNMDSFKLSTSGRRSSAVGQADSSSDDEDEAKAASFGGPSEAELRSIRIFKALNRLTNNLKGVHKIVVQIEELRFEIECTNFDIFSLLREETGHTGKKLAGAKAKKKIKRDENML